MKGIKVDNRLLIREASRNINRDRNTLTITMSIDPLKDAVYTQETLSELDSIHYTVSKLINPDLWNLLKDSLNSEFIEHVFNISKEWFSVYKAEAPKEIVSYVIEPDKREPVPVVDGMEEETPEYKLQKEIQEKYDELSQAFRLVEKYSFELIEI